MNQFYRAILGQNYLISQNLHKGVYVDNAYNRMLGRVGMTYGKDVSEEIREWRRVGTEDLYKDSNGNWADERVQEHSRIIDKAFKGVTPVPQGQKKTVTLLLGGGGSGKSYVYDNYFKADSNSVTINSDHVKSALPEANEFRKKDWISWAAKLHKESSDITEVMLGKAMDEGYNFTLDGTLSKQDYARSLIKELKERGYEIRVIGVMCDVHIAQYSALRRGHLGKDQRMVAGNIVKNANIGAKKTLRMLFEEGLVDNISVYDNSGQNRSKPPKIIVDNNEIKDVDQLKKFLKK